jgi:hypothetical protein
MQESAPAGQGKDTAFGQHWAVAGAVATLALAVWSQASAQGESLVIDPAAYVRDSHLRMYYAGADVRAVIEMTLIDRGGGSRVLRFTLFRRDEEEGGRQRFFAYFLEPDDLRRTSFMFWKDPDSDDARWTYVPQDDRVMRIPAKEAGSSFVGSDLSYEDLSGRHWTQDEHEFVRAESIRERRAKVVQSVPREKDWFERKLTWIDDETHLPLREEYYDGKGLRRILVAERIERIGEHPTIVRRNVENVRTGHKTIVELVDLAYDVGIDETLFSESSLANPPAEFVRE